MYIMLFLFIALICFFLMENTPKNLAILLSYIRIVILFKTYSRVSLLIFYIILILIPPYLKIAWFILNNIGFSRKVA